MINDKDCLLFKCPNCGKVFKLVSMDEPYRDFVNCIHTAIYTDFGDKMNVIEMDNITWVYTICCNQNVISDANDIMVVEDWIADRLFNVKGG